jgi:integrase
MKPLRLFTRSAAPAAPLYFRFEFTWQGQRHVASHCTGLTDRAAAQKYAQAWRDQYITAIKAGHYEAVKHRFLLRAPATAAADCTLDEYLATYEATATGESQPAHRHAAALALRRVAATTSASHLSQLPDAIAAYFQAAAQRAEAAAQDEALTVKRTCNSTLNQAASCFSAATLRCLPRSLTLPPLDPITTAFKRHVWRLPAKTAEQYRPPPPEVLDRTLRAWLTLPDAEFFAVGLALTFGLRASEIFQARWEWLTVRECWHCLDTSAVGTRSCASAKDHTGLIRVKALAPFHTILLGRDALQRVLTGHIVTAPRDKVCRAVSAWMQSLGWETRLHLHALRAYAGSLVFSRFGPLEARDFLRHASVTTTEAHYAWLVNLFRPQDPAAVRVLDQPVEFARVQQTFTPAVLNCA